MADHPGNNQKKKYKCPPNQGYDESNQSVPQSRNVCSCSRGPQQKYSNTSAQQGGRCCGNVDQNASSLQAVRFQQNQCNNNNQTFRYSQNFDKSDDPSFRPQGNSTMQNCDPSGEGRGANASRSKCNICASQNCNCPPENIRASDSANEDSSKFCMGRTVEVSSLVKSQANKSSSVQKTRQLSPSDWRDLQFRKLAKDSYCPGTIQDAADGNVNYNALVLNLMKDTFGSIPKDPGPYAPYSLLELFGRRIHNERNQVKHFLGDSKTSGTAEIDAYFLQKVNNDTNRAISSLLKAEKAIQVNETPASADYDLNVNKLEVNLPNCLLAVAYMGTTIAK